MSKFENTFTIDQESFKKLNKEGWVFWPIYRTKEYVETVIEHDTLTNCQWRDEFHWLSSSHSKDGNDHIDKFKYVRIVDNQYDYRTVIFRHKFEVKRRIRLW